MSRIFPPFFVIALFAVFGVAREAVGPGEAPPKDAQKDSRRAMSAPEVATALEDLHGAYVGGFGSSTGFGNARMPAVRHFVLRPSTSGVRFDVTRVELMAAGKSLGHGDPFVVFEGKTKRPLDAFEEKALRAIKGGSDVFYEPVEGGVRMVGALRAATTCARCHHVSEGTLLGTLSYLLKEKPRGDAKP